MLNLAATSLQDMPSFNSSSVARRLRNEPFESIRIRLGDMDDCDNSEIALRELQQWICWHPLVPEAFVLLAEIYERMGSIGEAAICLQRALELKEVLAQRQPSEAVLRLLNYEKEALEKLSAISVGGIVFQLLHLVDNNSGIALVGSSLEDNFYIKIEICPSQLKTNSLLQEASILEKLSRASSNSAPQFHSSGVLQSKNLERVVNPEDWAKIKQLVDVELPYYIKNLNP